MNHSQKRIILFLCLFTLLGLTSQSYAGDNAAGKQKFYSWLDRMQDVCKNGNVKVFQDYHFRICQPNVWGDMPLSGRIVWHSTPVNDKEGIDCGVMVTKDSSFDILDNDSYAEHMTPQEMVKSADAFLENMKISIWEKDHKLSGKKALHFVYTAEMNGIKQATFGMQTINNGALYSFFCNAPPATMTRKYKDFLDIADTFRFNP